MELPHPCLSTIVTFQGLPYTNLDVEVEELTRFYEALEAYGPTGCLACSDYPNTNRTTMTTINIQTGNVNPPRIPWIVRTPIFDCQQDVDVVNDSSTQGEVNLFYYTPMDLSPIYMAWKGVSNDQGIWFNYYDRNNWISTSPCTFRQRKVQGVGTSVGPSIMLYNGRLYMAWKGTSNDQGIWFNSFNGTNWEPQQKVQGVGTSVGPSLAVFNGRLYMAWKGTSNDQGIWFNSFNGTNWEPQQKVQGVGTSVGPSLAVFNGRLYMAWKGTSNDQGIWFNSFNGY